MFFLCSEIRLKKIFFLCFFLPQPQQQKSTPEPPNQPPPPPQQVYQCPQPLVLDGGAKKIFRIFRNIFGQF